MQVFDLGNPGQIVPVRHRTYGYTILPDDSVILMNVPMTMPGATWEQTHQQLKLLIEQNITAGYIFVDVSYDPVRFSNREIQQQLSQLSTYFPSSKVVFLSSRVQHWYDNISNILYVPYFMYIRHWYHAAKIRAGRIGCLNRNNTPHRIWLMHNLLKQGLLDQQCDVFSISFANIYTGERPIISNWLGINAPYDIDYEISQWPDSVASHPDGFPNDFSTDHPAWNTGIAVITETEVGYATMLTEKTWKAIRSSCCWTSYMSDEGYQFLEQIGFEPRFFKEHASFNNIEPIVDICKTISTEAAALDYYHSKINQIKHNFEWSGGDNPDSFVNFSTPWHQRFLPEFNRRLNSL